MAFQIIRNDITKVRADVIVNSANPMPVYGRGTDSAIYAAAGAEELLREREKIGEIAPGEAAVTPAFRLDAKYIIHTVGPVWQDGSHGERETVRACYENSLRLAEELGCESIAFPLLATGVYGFPKEDALEIAVSASSVFLMHSDMEITLVVYDPQSFVLSGKLFSGINEYIDDHYVAEQDALQYYQAAKAPEPEKKSRREKRKEKQEERRAEKQAEKREGRREEQKTKERSGRRGFLGSVARKDAGAFSASVMDEEASADESLEEGFREEVFADEAVEIAEETASAAEGEFPIDEAETAGVFGSSLTGMSPSAGMPQNAGFALSAGMSMPAMEQSAGMAKAKKPRSLEELISQVKETWQESLFRLIDEKGYLDTEVYKRANVDRKLFSKIRSNPNYQPKKNTAMAFALALRLSLDETRDLLARAGYALSPSSRSDLIVEYFIENEVYDIYTINLALFEHDEQLLGY